jgi:ribosomal protein L35AE/L33A
VTILSQTILTGRIINYRTGPKTQQSKECLIQFNNISFGEAGQLIGKKVVWSSNTKKLTGIIKGLHGHNGTVKVRFRRSVPGQAIGTVVELTI